MRIEELRPIRDECTNATTKKPQQRPIYHHIIINTGGTIWARMNNNRFTNNVFSNDEHTEILIDKEHIISQITKFFINVERLRKEIYPAFMVTLIAKPFNNSFIH